jgi:penicillin-binding protein 1A
MVYGSGITAGLMIIAVLVGLFIVAVQYPLLPNIDILTNYQPKIPLRIVSREGILLGEFGEERRSFVKIEDVPVVMKNAILAAEDTRFYEHAGVDYIGVLRSVLANLRGNKQGASTITMQVARNFFLTLEQSYIRKFREILLAKKIEAHLTKDQILELYINQIFLGQRAHGFAAAARIYFDKPLDQITVAEAAMLAGLPKSPSRYNPVVNPERAVLRQKYILGRMHAFHFIDDATYQAALNEKLVLRAHGSQKPRLSQHAEYVAEMARRKIYEVYGAEAYTRGLTVWTTISADYQAAAYQSVRQGVIDYDFRHGYRGPEGFVALPENTSENDLTVADRIFANYPDYENLLPAAVLSADPKEVRVLISNGVITTLSGARLDFARKSLNPKAPDSERIRRGAIIRVSQTKNGWTVAQLPQVEASLVALNPQTGALLALVGGFDFGRNQFNHAIQAMRQPGSSFKPFIYSAALEKGFSPATIVNDGPFFIPAEEAGGVAWEPHNYDEKFDGPMRLRTALARSKNLVMVRVLQSISPQYAQDYITRFGFSASQHPPYLTMALGAGSATPMQMASAYGVFANGGYYITPYFIDLITDAHGEIVQSHSTSMIEESKVLTIDPRNAFVINSMLQSVVTEGTAQRARVLQRSDIAGKTGTTNNFMDAWFCGYNANIVGVVWTGFDQPRSLGKGEGGSTAALPMWIQFMKDAMKETPETPREPPPNVVSVPVDLQTGLRDDGSPNHEWFYYEFQPPTEQELMSPSQMDFFDKIF